MSKRGGVSGSRGRTNGRYVSNLPAGMRLLDTVDAFVGVPPSVLPLEPSPPAARAPARVSDLDNDEGVADEIWDKIERIELKVNRKLHTGELMFDDIKVTRSFRPIFRMDIVKGAINWRNVPTDKKEFYFQEFRKKFKWRKGQGSIVRSTWEAVASIRYRDLIHECKSAWEEDNEVQKPNGFSEEVWKFFTDYWTDPKVCDISKQHATNRRGGKDVAPATHTGGSIPHFLHAKRKAIENDGKMPTHLDVFESMHTLKDSKTHCNSKAANVIAECKKRKAEAEVLSQLTTDSSNETVTQTTQVNVNNIFFKVLKDINGGLKNGRSYGAAAETFATPIGGLEEAISVSFASAGYLGNDEMKQKIDQILDAKLAERDARLLQQMAEILREKQGHEQTAPTSTPGCRNDENDITNSGNNVVHEEDGDE